jgi:hypothetical protein
MYKRTVLRCSIRKDQFLQIWLKLKIKTEEIYVKYQVSRRILWAGNVARMRQERCIQEFGGKNLRERDHLENPSVNGRIILKWIFKELG